MKKLFACAATVLVACGVAPAANAATTVTTFTPGMPGFTVSGNPFMGTVSANIGHSGIAAGAFEDIFDFTLGQTGLGSGSISTSTSIFHDNLDVDISSVTINGMAATAVKSAGDLYESFYLYNVPITTGTLNQIIVTGVARGNGSYGGNATFSPAVTAVPESSTWIMMIFGFGLAGATMRYKRKSTKVAYA